MASLVQRWAERIAEDAVREYFASTEFKTQLRWIVQGFERGYTTKDRARFTATVTDRIRLRGRRPIYVFGRRVWRAKLPITQCAAEAERIVTEFLRSENIQFGDPQYSWEDGADLAEADMDYWEACA